MPDTPPGIPIHITMVLIDTASNQKLYMHWQYTLIQPEKKYGQEFYTQFSMYLHLVLSMTNVNRCSYYMVIMGI